MESILNRKVAGRSLPRLSQPWFDALILAVVVALLVILWLALSVRVTITVDGVADSLRTRRATVSPLLADAGLSLSEYDRISPSLVGDVTAGTEIVVERARPVRLLVDGRDLTQPTRASTVGDALRDAGVVVDPYDRALVDGVEVTLETPLPPLLREPLPTTYDRGYAWQSLTETTPLIRLRRAIPMTVDEGSAPYIIRTTAPTVGEALRQAEVTLYLGDRVEPSLGSAVTAGLRVFIGRSTPVRVDLGGKQVRTRVQADTVGDALSGMGVVLAGLDKVEPSLETELYPNINIRVTRIAEDIEIEEQIEPFETVYRGDPNLDIDVQQVLEPGAEGITRQRYRVRYENGEAISRTLEDDWLAQSPAQRVIAYGQRITPQTAVVDGQTITYWRRIRMLATSYSAESAGGNRTYTGDTLRPGIVAVDPRLIPLRSQVFVPGYGIGDALDTGGGIRSRRIDLAYDSANFKSVLGWTDVYLLWPPPAASDITWVVPNYPRVPD